MEASKLSISHSTARFNSEASNLEERYAEFSQTEVAPPGTKQEVRIPEYLSMIEITEYDTNRRALPCLPEKLASALRPLSTQLLNQTNKDQVPARYSKYQWGQHHEFIVHKNLLTANMRVKPSNDPSVLISLVEGLKNFLPINPLVEVLAKQSVDYAIKELNATIHFAEILPKTNIDSPIGKLGDETKRWGSLVLMFEYWRIKIGSVYHGQKRDFAHREKQAYFLNYRLDVTKLEHGSNVTQIVVGNDSYSMFHNEGYFLISNNNRIVFAGLKTSLDYMIMVAEYSFNLNLLADTHSHASVRPYIKSILDLKSVPYTYDNYVALAKATENLSWQMMDIDHMKVPTLLGLYDAMKSLVGLGHPSEINIMELTREVFGLRANNKRGVTNQPYESLSGWELQKLHQPISKMLYAVCNLPSEHLGTSSSLHKFRAIKYINLDEMMTKYSSRVIKRYETNPDAIKKLLRLARRNFTTGYIKKNKKIPKMRCIGEEDIYDEVWMRLNAEIVNSVEAVLNVCLDLDQWDHIEPYNCLFLPKEVSDIHYITDKACAAKKINFESDQTSTRAIISVCEEENSGKINDYFNFANDLGLLHDFKEPKEFHWRVTDNPQEIRTFFELDDGCESYLFTKQVAKEGEQNEGRVYAEAVEKSKRALSRSMDFLKHAIDYYDSQIMTKSDRDRKMRLHKMAQRLRSPDSWAIMADISGHNQSMCPENTEELCDFLFGLYGLEGGSYLPHLFKNLKIFMKDKQTDHWFICKGQYGAIEGWMNPLWGCQSALIMELFCIEQRLESSEVATYSDDILSVFKRASMPVNEKYNIIIDLQKHFLAFGQLLKPTQTQLSGTRITLLKNHYIDGFYCSATLKRICAISTFHSSGVYSEKQEINGISSSISSSCEFSDHILGIHIIKYLRTLMLTTTTLMRSCNNIYEKFKKKGDLTDIESIIIETFDHRYRALLKPTKGFSQFKDLPEYLIKDVKVGQPLNVGTVTYMVQQLDPFIIKMYRSEQIIHFSDLSHMAKTEILYCLIQRYADIYSMDMTGSMHSLFWKMNKAYDFLTIQQIILLLPESVGGYGLIPIQASCMTGYSFSKVKVLHLLDTLCKQNCTTTMRKRLRAWYCSYFLAQDEANLVKLVTSEFPTYDNTRTSDSITADTVKSIITSGAVRNIFINNLFRANKQEDKEFTTNLVTIFSDRFVFRFVRKYYDLSHIALRDKYAAKFEHSKTILKLINKLRGLTTQARNDMAFNYFRDMWELPSRHMRHLYSRPYNKHDFPPLDQPIDSYLFKRKQRIYTTITIDDYYQPLVEPYIHVTTGGRLTVYQDEALTHTTRGIEYNTPAYRSPVKPKYRKDDLFCEYYNDLRTFYVLESVRFTKWMIASSIYFKETNVDELINDNAYIYACNYILFQYTDDLYEDLQDYVMTPTGGLPAHRVNNSGLVDKSVIRAYPNLSGSYKIHMSPELFDNIGGEDSNLDIDYLQLRTILSLLLYNYYTEKSDAQISLLSVDWADMDVPFANVATSFLSKQKEIVLKRYTKWESVVLQPTDKLVVKSISRMLMDQPDYSDLYNFNFVTALHNYYSPDVVWLSMLKIQEILKIDYEISYLDVTPEQKTNIILEIARQVEKEVNIEAAIVALDNHFKLQIVDLELKGDLFSCALAHIRRVAARHQSFSLSNRYITREVVRELRAVTESAYRFVLELLLKGYISVNITHIPIEGEYNNYIVDIMEEKTIGVLLSIVKAVKTEHKIVSRDRSLQLVLKCLEMDYLVTITKRVLKDLSTYIAEDQNFALNLVDDIYKFNSSVVIPTINQVKDHEITMIETEIDCSIYSVWEQVVALVNARRHYVGYYASLTAYESPTYSDAFQTALGVVKVIKEDYKGRKEPLYITDLTAGRGDFEIALSRLSVEHTSYCLDDYYSKFNCSPSLNRYTYDITNYDSMKVMDLSGVIVIDISYITSTNKEDEEAMQGLWITILELLKRGREVVLRMNSLRLAPRGEVLTELCKYTMSMLSSSGQTKKMSPYVYLRIKPALAHMDKGGQDNDIISKSYMNVLRESFQFLRTLQYSPGRMSIKKSEMGAGFNKYRMCLSDNKIKSIMSQIRGEGNIKTQFSFRAFNQYFNDLILINGDPKIITNSLVKPPHKSQLNQYLSLIEEHKLEPIGTLYDGPNRPIRGYPKKGSDEDRRTFLMKLSDQKLLDLDRRELHPRDCNYTIAIAKSFKIREVLLKDYYLLGILSCDISLRKLFMAGHFILSSTNLIPDELKEYPLLSPSLTKHIIEQPIFKDKYLGYLTTRIETQTEDLIRLAIASFMQSHTFSAGHRYLASSAANLRKQSKLVLGHRYRLICAALSHHLHVIKDNPHKSDKELKFNTTLLSGNIPHRAVTQRGRSDDETTVLNYHYNKSLDDIDIDNYISEMPEMMSMNELCKFITVGSEAVVKQPETLSLDIMRQPENSSMWSGLVEATQYSLTVLDDDIDDDWGDGEIECD
jgi:hypothetical protein